MFGMSEKIEQDNAIIKGIAENYIRMEETIVKQLQFSCQHHVTIGGFREEIWKSLFEQIIPKKFSIERSVFIIDSFGHVSNEVDLAIFDEQYTPYIFNYGKMKYIPIEAVAVVVQCKSSDLRGIADWVDSITKMRTSLKSVARMHSSVISGEFEYEEDPSGKLIFDKEKHKFKLTQTSTRPIRILCHLDESATTSRKGVDQFDIIISPKEERLKVQINPENENLNYWYNELNHVDPKYERFRSEFGTGSTGEIQMENYRVYNDKDMRNEISLLSLIFQLNQLLMLINNPILFPHRAYVDLFNCQA